MFPMPCEAISAPFRGGLSCGLVAFHHPCGLVSTCTLSLLSLCTPIGPWAVPGSDQGQDREQECDHPASAHS